MSTLLADERPTARRTHGCCACRGWIQPGDQYRRQRIVDGGDAWVWKAHLLCDAVVVELNREAGWAYDDEPPDPGEVQEMIGNVLGGLLLGATP